MSTPARHTADLLEQAASQWGEKPFLVEEGISLSFSAVLDKVRALAWVDSRGASRGTRIAIWAPNCTEWVIGALAIHYLVHAGHPQYTL